MLFRKERTTEYYLGDTHVENVFINEIMIDAPGDYVKVYLFALMYAELGMAMTNDEIARHLHMDIEDVLKAWTFWENQAAIRKYYENPSNKLQYEVEFLNLKSLIYGKKRKYKKKKDDLTANVKDLIANEDLRKLCIEIESIIGTTLPSEGIEETLSWVSIYGAEPEVVKYAYRYAERKAGNSGGIPAKVSYVGKIVKSWTDKKLKSVDDVTQYLAETDKSHYQHKRVLKALGMTRGATEEEQRIIDSWFNELGMDMETVLEACKKTSGTTNPNINYVNTVVNSWDKEGKGAGKTGSRIVKGKKQIAEALKHFEELRAKNESEAETRKLEVYEQVPAIKQLDQEIRGVSMEISKIMLSGAVNTKDVTERLRKKIEEIKAEKAFLMTENNYSIDYMDIVYACETCKDTGTTDTGERCACFHQFLKNKSKNVE
jgi:DnaD/phage-associated family protein